MSHRSLLFTVFLMLSLGSAAQYYDTGTDPSSLKWMQIKTGRFKIIYPAKYGSEATSFANSLSNNYIKLLALYPEKNFKIPVIIHNFTTQSNGYVAWAPRRMELYPTPEQNSIPLDPDEQLAIHELTHVFQMESLNRGFTKIMSFGFGEQITGVVSSLLPLWFLEGDAVFAETILTGSGRGRSPSFQEQLKAITTENGIYKYDKMINGSYRNFIPDHYQTGYQMIAWSYAKYDHQLWNYMLRFTADQPFTINPVNISLSKRASLTKKKLFDETFDGLKKIWEQDISQNGSQSYETISPSKSGKYINYYSPVIAGSDSVIAIKTSLTEPASFVLIRPSEKSEHRIHTPGYMYPWYISYAKGKIVWIENQYDPRWENRNYSVIKIMDLKTRITTRLTLKSRYMSASVSPDGKLIAAVENSYENKNSIVFIDPDSGHIVQTAPSPGNVYLQRPQWSDDGTKLTIISLTHAGEGIISYSPADQKWQTMIEPGVNDLQSSFLRNDTLFFISSSSGTDNIYFLSPDKKISGVTNSRFGANDLCIYGERLIFADYSSSGNDICNMGLNEVRNNLVLKSQPTSFLINSVNHIEYQSSDTNKSVYSPVPYRKWQHLFNFHSWMPFYADIKQVQTDPASIRPGFTIMSQNNLSTLTSTLGYEYSVDKRHLFHTRLTWKGWYPVIESQLDYGYLPLVSKSKETDADPLTIQPGMSFLNTVSLPLTFTSGKFTQYLFTSFTSDYRNNYVFLGPAKGYDYGQTELTTRLYFSNYHISAIRDIYPRWAQVFDFNNSFSPFDKEINGTSNSIKTAFYFPGILSNNSIKIRFEKEKQKIVKFYMGNRIRWPRSYQNIYSRNLNFLSVDYAMPLFYPDFNISSLFYLKRIRADLFYDFARGKGNAYFNQTATGLNFSSDHDYYENFKSYGFELLTDFHLFRSPFMISSGVQCAWQDITKSPFLEFIFNIDIFGMSIGRSGL